MKGTLELVQKFEDLSSYSILVPNLYGFQLAKDNKVEELCLVLCVTESMNLKNINQNISDSIKDFRTIIKESKNEGIRTKCYISVAFHCPYEGKVDPGHVSALIDEILDYGIDEIVIADTIGAANPSEVKELLKRQLRTNDTGKFSMHFHDTKALALSNIYASLEEGISKFDSCIGGLGGCPFAPGASGNLATEDLVSMLHMMNFDTGIDIDLLHQSRELASDLTGLKLLGRMPYSGSNA
jgi:hydroxymethylglutaryl-CoA lyase